jgi:thiol-disulfide isomerase/thioredoxin
MMEKIPVMNKQELLTRLGDGQYVLEFMAEWCPDCNFIKPHLPEIEADFPEYRFLQVDRDQNLDLFKEFNVFGIPSFIVVKNGKEAGRLVNKARKTKEDVETFLNKIE